MKNLLLVLCICIFSVAKAQTLDTQSSMDNVVVTPDGFFTRGVKVIKDETTEGSPFIDGKAFHKVKLSGFSAIKEELRYNAFTDEMEFDDKGTLYNLTKQSALFINFPELKKTYVCLNYNVDGNNKFGYLVSLVDGDKAKLYKREKIEFISGTKSTNAFLKDAKDYYEKEKDLYLVNVNYQFYKVTKSIDEFANRFGERSQFIKDFAKSNKINLSKEADLIKLVEFINQN